MNPITVTVIGRLGDDPRIFTTRDGTTGVELRLALDLPSRVPGGDGITRWVKVTAFGMLAERTAASVGKGDRVTVIADDLMAEAWTSTSSGEPRARVALRAREIAASMAFDSLRTGYAARKAARLAAWCGGRGPGPPRRHHHLLTFTTGPGRARLLRAPHHVRLLLVTEIWLHMTRDSALLERVRKLLAKAEAEGITAAEAEALTAKAAELMARYGIDRALLAARTA
jgi:single-stranded DNA-binding protein